MSDMTDAQLLDYAAGLSAAPSSDEHDEGSASVDRAAASLSSTGVPALAPRRTPPSSRVPRTSASST